MDFGDKSDSYEWDFENKNAGAKTQLAHSHVFEAEGTYELKLRVVDDDDESSEAKVIVTITDPPEGNVGGRLPVRTVLNAKPKGGDVRYVSRRRP